MYKVENVRIVCERDEYSLQRSIMRHIPEGYVPKSISQTSQGDLREMCALLVKMKD